LVGLVDLVGFEGSAELPLACACTGIMGLLGGSIGHGGFAIDRKPTDGFFIGGAGLPVRIVAFLTGI